MKATRESFDLVLDTDGTSQIGLMIDREARTSKGDLVPLNGVEIAGGFGAAEADRSLAPEEESVVFDRLLSGMGYSRRLVDGGYSYGENIWARQPGAVGPAGAVTEVTLPVAVVSQPTHSFEMGAHLYFLCGRHVVKVPNGADAPETAQDLGAGFTAKSVALFNGSAYIGGEVAGAPANIWRFDGTTWTQDADVARRFLATVWWEVPDNATVSAQRLIGTDTASTFRHVAGTPFTAGDWSAAIAVGTTSYDIHTVIVAGERVLFVKRNGVHDVEGVGTKSPNLTTYWETELSSDNGAAALVHGRWLYVTLGNGLDRIDLGNLTRKDEPEYCHVGAYLANETPIFGPVTALTSDMGWVLAAVYNGTNSYILAGMDRARLGVPGIGPMVWHGAEYVLSSGKITHLRKSALASGGPRLWIGSLDGSTPKLRWQSLPRAQSALQDYKNGGPMRFATSATLHTGAQDWKDATSLKVLRKMELRTTNLGSGVSIAVKAGADDAALTTQGSTTQGRAVIEPQTDVVTGHELDFDVVFTSTTTVPAILRTMKVRAEVNVDLYDAILVPVTWGRGVVGRHGEEDARDPYRVWTLLAALQRRGPVTCVLPTGQQVQAKLEQGIRYKLTEDKRNSTGDDEWRYRAVIRLTLTDTASVEHGAWGDGSLWGDGSVWA